MKRLSLVLLLAFAASFFGARARGAGYGFSVPEAKVTVTIEKDGSALIHYWIKFKCANYAKAIDVVDIGMPTSKHQPISAALDDSNIPLSLVSASKYVTNAYEIRLPGRITPGQEGVFEFTARSHDMVWQDTTNPEQVSFRFTPTWFDENLIQGSTRLVLRYRLPIPKDDYPKVKDKILWQRKHEKFSFKGVMEGEDVPSVAWVRTVQLNGPNTFSVSFPKQYVTKVMEKTLWGLFYDDWWKRSPQAQLASGIFLLIVFAIVLFTATRGTGWSVFIVLAALLGILMYKSPGGHLLLYPVMGVLAVLVLRFRSGRKQRYFPATLCREGGGIKRGLTAVEAAVLLEAPFNKILTMIIFGLAKKGVIKITSREPLRVELVGAEKSPGVWLLPGDAPVKLWPFEPDFIAALKAQAYKPVEELRLKKPFDNLIKLVVGALEGFDLIKTRDYYKYIVSRAWKQVKAESDYEARFKQADKKLDWMMLDDDWGSGMNDLGGGGYYYHPWWWYGHSRHSYAGSSGGGLFGGGGGGGGGAPDVTAPDTSFGDVANSLTGRLETLSNDLSGSLDSIAEGTGSGLDLSSFDTFTSEALESMASGSGGGGGGGGCACAGCACACACAGGGR
jgi:hypothetical protein